MKRPLVLGLLCCTLAACGQTAVTYDLSFDVEDKTQQQELTLASLRVIERRLQGIGEELVDHEVHVKDGITSLQLTLTNDDVGDILTSHMTQPYDLEIMEQAPDESADIVVAKHGGFKATGITGTGLQGANAGRDSAGKGFIRLFFTEQGAKMLSDVFKKNKGKYIGLFVRDRLISKLMVESDSVQDQILIRDIPDPDLAEIFADDLNVGLHVTFQPSR